RALRADRPERDRTLPELTRGLALGQVAEGSLAELEPTRLDHLHADQREARLEDPGVHDLAGWLAGREFERVPEIGRLGVGVLMLAEIGRDATPEDLGPQILLKHAQNGGALLIGQD